MSKKNEIKVTPVVVVDKALQGAYALLIADGEDANLQGMQFIQELAERLNTGLTQDIAKNSMKELVKNVRIQPVVRYSHIPSVTIASLIIARFESEILDVPVAKVLSLSARVLADKKAGGALKHITKAETFAELNELTLSKAESQARDKGEKVSDDIAEKANAITLESIAENTLLFFKGKNLQDIKTADLALIHKVAQLWVTIERNSKVA
jgi:cell division protein FtsB